MNQSRYCNKLEWDDVEKGMYVTILDTNDGEPIKMDTERGEQTIAITRNRLEQLAGKVFRVEAVCIPYILMTEVQSGEMFDVDGRTITVGELNEDYVAKMHAYIDHQQMVDEFDYDSKLLQEMKEAMGREDVSQISDFLNDEDYT